MLTTNCPSSSAAVLRPTLAACWLIQRVSVALKANMAVASRISHGISTSNSRGDTAVTSQPPARPPSRLATLMPAMARWPASSRRKVRLLAK